MRCPRCLSRSFVRDQEGGSCLLCGHRGPEARPPSEKESVEASRRRVGTIGGHGMGRTETTWYVRAKGVR